MSRKLHIMVVNVLELFPQRAEQCALCARSATRRGGGTARGRGLASGGRPMNVCKRDGYCRITPVRSRMGTRGGWWGQDVVQMDDGKQDIYYNLFISVTHTHTQIDTLHTHATIINWTHTSAGLHKKKHATDEENVHTHTPTIYCWFPSPAPVINGLKTQIPFGHDLFSFPLISRQLATDSQRGRRAQMLSLHFWHADWRAENREVGRVCVCMWVCACNHEVLQKHGALEWSR